MDFNFKEVVYEGFGTGQTMPEDIVRVNKWHIVLGRGLFPGLEKGHSVKLSVDTSKNAIRIVRTDQQGYKVQSNAVNRRQVNLSKRKRERLGVKMGDYEHVGDNIFVLKEQNVTEQREHPNV